MNGISVAVRRKGVNKPTRRPIDLVCFRHSHDKWEHGLLTPVTQLSKRMMRARILIQERATGKSATATVDTLRKKTSLANAHLLGARISILKTKMFCSNLLPVEMISIPTIRVDPGFIESLFHTIKLLLGARLRVRNHHVSPSLCSLHLLNRASHEPILS